MKIGFLGAGKMATALAKGLISHNIYAVEDLAATDVSATSRAAFEKTTGIRCTDDPRKLLGGIDTMVLAVKPQHAAEAVAPIANLCGDKLIVSIAAGLALAKLSSWFGHDRIIRVMPNTPAMVGRGAAVYSCGGGVGEADRALAERIFGAVGIVLQMPEEKLDAVTALSGSGPAYVFELVRVLVAGAERIGLDGEDSLLLISQTFAGAAEMLLRKMGTPEELRRAVTSPGGTTEAALKVLNEADFPQLMARMLEKARDRSLELGRG